MNIALEYKKIKRTGILPGCLAGGVLAAFIPILELMVRSEQYTGLMQSPLRTIFQADWQMMSMLNMLAVVAVTCMMYHTEYADRAILRITTLPVREEEIFCGKVLLTAGMCFVLLVIEMLAVIFCTLYWFGGENGAYSAFYGDAAAGAYLEFIKDLFKSFGYCFCMLLPAAASALLIASVCKNMWISLGIDVVCVFIATMIPARYFALSLFPFALPCQIFEEAPKGEAIGYLIAAIIEAVSIGAAEMIILRVRRSLS